MFIEHIGQPFNYVYFSRAACVASAASVHRPASL